MAVKLFAYRRGNSILHKTPALLKLAVLMTLCIVTFSGASVVRIGICLLISVIVFILSGAHKESLKQISFVAVIGTVITIFDMLYFQFSNSTVANATENIIMVLPFFGINMNGLYDGLLYTVRFFITALAAQVVFETTSSLEIQDAFEAVQNVAAKIIPPLKKWNPAFVISLTINFIPEVFETWNKVNLAARARTNSSGKNRKGSRGKSNTILIMYQELLALFSCLLHFAEMKRQAILNRSGEGRF